MTVLEAAPPFVPTMPRTGKPFSVRMSNCGSLGWVSDKAGGYRYQPTHPETGEAWPPIPAILLDLWSDVASYPELPEACLVNIYSEQAKMGLHRDEDEEDFAAPVLSVSLGDTARFRIGGTARKDPTRSFDLESGDVVVLGGESRLVYHGVDRIKPGTAELGLDCVPGAARINLTLRRVSTP
ncbi:MAG: alpha-ketoglutarate-dependent dioxygenase AlkB [Hyphomicrobiaceae bacterium]|nr:alpha-ketoglutarate-dependent dioxygenase AlkB [Hyphomicrobiaceae bacterium]